MNKKSDLENQQNVREIAETQISIQKEKASGGLGQLVQALRKSEEHLRGQQQEQIAGYVEKAANQLERISESIKTADLRQWVDQVEGLARREPAMFLGGAFALGLLGARFLKSSGRHGGYQYGMQAGQEGEH
jgi:hypothetical protein